MPTREYPSSPAGSKSPVTHRRRRRAMRLAERLRRCGEGNAHHTAELRWTRRRWKRERDTTRELAELPTILHGLGQLQVRTGDPRVGQLGESLQLVTPEGLGLMWYEPSLRARRRAAAHWYIPADADGNVSAFRALLHEATRLLYTWGPRIARESRRLLAVLARAMRREGLHVYDHVSPDPTTGDVSLERDISGSSDGQLGRWLSESTVKRLLGGGEEVR